ncbi:MAG: LPS export ABC transporter ATP-binding protein [Deltaproteobacteria bacterium]|nr:LPS export ABC transporter ATP-binding protein [Deltaproteobacteria bacterium]
MAVSYRLVARELSKSYQRRRVVEGVSLTLDAGQVVGLLGPNGAGKTTTFYMVVGLVKPDSGNLLLNDHDLTGLTLPQRARQGISYLPQEASVFRKLSVADNLLAIIQSLGLDREAEKKRLDSMLKRFGLEKIRDNRAYTVSGGERRRVEIARALVLEPKFILLDEPFAGIDPLAVSDIQQIIVELKAQGIGVLISDHNVRETLGICDYAYIMDQGSILEEGEPQMVIASPKARRIYLGEDFHL